LPASVARGRNASARIKVSAPGYLTVQLLDSRGSLRSRRVLHFAKSGSRATLRLPTRHLARGRYLTVWHFVGANGWAGPVVARKLRIR
jgi:hypothetical protein